MQKRQIPGMGNINVLWNEKDENESDDEKKSSSKNYLQLLISVRPSLFLAVNRWSGISISPKGKCPGADRWNYHW
jgi:hypothetical protein